MFGGGGGGGGGGGHDCGCCGFSLCFPVFFFWFTADTTATTDADTDTGAAPDTDADAVCGLYIPKRNLVDDSDNENNYYIRLADELLRYRRIRAYMLHPNKYLTFDSISYNLKDNEMLLLDADVPNYISENKRAITTNDYIEYKSY